MHDCTRTTVVGAELLSEAWSVLHSVHASAVHSKEWGVACACAKAVQVR
jgi:hypothetical protein